MGSEVGSEAVSKVGWEPRSGWDQMWDQVGSGGRSFGVRSGMFMLCCIANENISLTGELKSKKVAPDYTDAPAVAEVAR